MDNTALATQDTKQIFMKCGACSHTYFYVLNREFGHPKEPEELASDPLAGGLMHGQQCGMLWGASLAAGAESFRRNVNQDQAIGAAITTTRQLMESFSERAKSVNCRDVVGVDFSDKFGIVKFILKALLHGGIKNSTCFNLAEKWTPEAIQTAREGLSRPQTDIVQQPINCAAEVARKMGASDEEMVMVAGFAGGMGLSGNACGALGAAIWMNTLTWLRNHPREIPPSFNQKNTARIFEAFDAATGSEILCHKIAGQNFKTIDEHTEFIRNGGCKDLINVLTQEAI
jgi:hypothetical protein